MENITFKDNPFYIHKNDLISNIIKNTNNFYEIDIFNNFISFFPNNGLFLDIGANIGNHSIMFTHHFPEVEIFSFEPFPSNYNLLHLNTKPYENIIPHKIALGSETGIVHMMSPDINNQGASQITKTGNKVIVIDLDSLNLKNITFIKIDIEGHEFSFCEGSFQTLKNNKPVIWIEDHNQKTVNYLIDNFDYKIKIKEKYNNYLLIP